MKPAAWELTEDSSRRWWFEAESRLVVCCVQEQVRFLRGVGCQVQAERGNRYSNPCLVSICTKSIRREITATVEQKQQQAPPSVFLCLQQGMVGSNLLVTNVHQFLILLDHALVTDAQIPHLLVKVPTTRTPCHNPLHATPTLITSKYCIQLHKTPCTVEFILNSCSSTLLQIHPIMYFFL